jgi:hypothetical protein
MPWMPEVFSAPLAEARRAQEEGEATSTNDAVPYYEGILPDEPDALVRSFAARQPVLDDPNLHAEGTPEEYQRALAEGDLAGIAATFEPEGYAREPSGAAYLHRGTEELYELYGHMFANGGGIPLEHCTLTDDGVRCAIEYNCVRWGDTELPPQAGVAVYERGGSGLLAAARIYDDVEPPTVSDTSIG